MRNWFFIIFLLFLIACKPVKSNLQCTVSYNIVQSQTENASLNKLIAPYKLVIDSEMNKIIGYSEIAMPKEKGTETLLGNFVADIVFQFAKTFNPKTDFCVLNNGGLRNSIPAGDITIRHIFELMPFDNEIVIVKLDGNNVEKVIGYIAEKGGVPVSGITLKLEKMNGNLFPSNIEILGQKFSRDSTYEIATSDYLATGGDNMNFWSTGTVVSTAKKLRDAIIEFIRLQTAQNKRLKGILDKRISYLY